ncbi:hypothetical protein BGZ80_004386 [Entomortierella chlamydospora]|uniref:Uncharacterized protein n=1 Tax=Entomortierella chlamydospora TaxID=101097 RepID=A0A9P6N1L8_9FUNG|nr:hypothetical protein BGZ80_004386 [Entomortierella chlamydospora]
MMFTLKAAFALTVIETFFADDLSDEQWKLIDNSWIVLQMWTVVFGAYFFSLASTMLSELTEAQEARARPFGSIDNTFGNSDGSNNNNGSTSNERSPLLPSVRPTEPIKTVAVDSF